MISETVFKKFLEYTYGEDHPTKEHMATLLTFGQKCDRIVEMGVWKGYSSWAWLAAEPKYLRLVDLRKVPDGNHDLLEQEAKAMDIDFKFELGDTGHGAKFKGVPILKRETDIWDVEANVKPYIMDDDIDLLFIDTYHSYSQLKAELTIHGPKVRKYIIFHDTAICGALHEFDGDFGLRPAIYEFIRENPNWYYIHEMDYGNGLTIIGNKDHVDDKTDMRPHFKYSLRTTGEDES